MNEIVKYDNYMNNLNFKHFTSVDFNFLMALCNKLRDKNVEEIRISFEDLRIKTGYTRTSINQFISDLKRMNKKLMEITCNLETEKKIIMFVLFPTFEIDLENQELIVSVNEKFSFILNELIKNFTRFDLQEFVTLESRYSKSLYRLLKQYRTTGKYEVAIGDFRVKMDCPDSYNNKQFMQNIINPAVKSLQNYFKELKCEPQYAHKRGRPVTGYIFTFTPENKKHGSDQNQIKSENKSNTKNVSNSFANFELRTYDYDQLERELLNRQKSDAEQLDNESIESQMKNMFDEMRK